MASRKRKAPSTPTQARFDRSRFSSQEAWERYTNIVVPHKLLPERNVVVYYTEFDEFKQELERRHWDEELIDFLDDNIDVAIVNEFYANLYDPEDKSPKQVRVKGHLIKFDEDTLNTYLKTPVVVEEGETLSAYSRFALLRSDPQELAAKHCIPGRGFELNADGQPLKILRKSMTMLAQTWSVPSFSNLIPTSHTSDVTLDKAELIYSIIMKMDMNVGYLISHQISLIAQHDTSRLGFPALITTLCKARGVHSDSRSPPLQHQRHQLLLLPQLHYLLFRLQLFLLHPHIYHFQLLYLQVHQILFLHHRCYTPCSKASTGAVHYHAEPSGLGLAIHYEHGGV